MANYKRQQDFFEGLSDIDMVIVIGHSLSEVDMEYFEKINYEIKNDAKWIFSCHDANGMKSIDSFTRKMKICTDKVTVFKL